MNKRKPKEAHPAALVCICQDKSVAEAARKMRDAGVGCLIITDAEGKLSGIVTERDIACRAAAELIDLEKTSVGQIMTADVIYCTADTEPRKAREIMAVNHIRHLPIIEDGKVVRIYSLRDVVQQQLISGRIAAEQVAMLSACLKSASLGEITKLVSEEVPKLFGAGRCTICLERKKSGRMAEIFSSDNGCHYPQRRLDETFLQEGSAEGCKLCSESLPEPCTKEGAAGPRLMIQINIDKAKSSSQQNPLSIRGALCMCGLENSKKACTPLMYYKAKLVKDILNVHITNIAQYEDARTASLTDSLTQVGSRQYFEEMLETESSRMNRYDRLFSIAMIDVDNFKDVNDKYGHIAGDSALKIIAECMNEHKRTCDILARFGGDEFVFILPETTSQEAVIMVERIRQKIRRTNIGNNYFVTVSSGIADAKPGRPIIATELISKADIALYGAKKAGKDCTKIWKEDSAKPKKEEVKIQEG
jgi:diguanylate cyclase (GGDEF)-like protein